MLFEASPFFCFPLSKFLHCYHNLLKVECQQLFYKK
nr:MAG TPA: hypothetical protein [Caudoviricetes sp.]